MIGYIIAFWLVCGFIAYGFGFAYLQREFSAWRNVEYFQNMRVSALLIIMGPFGLGLVLISKDYKHGWKLW